jgi:hypothetical protein
MFELLLQADKAIAGGFLDQAEKTYWQLIELDPTNAIAVAGLARISMERGDERMARTFAERALTIDPDSILARRLLVSIERGTPGAPEDDIPDLPLLAVEQLEAISRRRGKDGGEAADTPEAPEMTETEATKSAPRAAPAAAPKKDRGRTRPDQLGSMPAEPLHERRQAGRLAAAAAAAAAAAREPVRTRHEPHHAMPVGRFRFEPALKSPAVDEFSAAEMAAAVAAVDGLDDAAPQEVAAATEPEAAAEPRSNEFDDLLGTVDGTDADDSVALRLAMLGGGVDLDAAERAAAQEAESETEAQNDMFEAAEAIASGNLPHQPRAMLPSAASPAATESEWPSLVGPGESTKADAAESEAAAEGAAAARALHEVAGSAHAAPTAADDDRPYIRPRFQPLSDHAPTEEEAEAQALREAMAIVLAGDGEDAGPQHEPKVMMADSAIVADAPAEAATEPKTEPELAVEPEPEAPAADQAAGPEPEPEANEPEPAPQRRKGGLFHRIRGS